MEAMGTDDRLPAAALIARLLARPHDFDLFQAIHLLECAQSWARPLGTGDGTDEAVRLTGHVSLAFEPSDIRHVRSQAAGNDRATYTVSTAAMTLAGASGPLPLAFTEWLLNRRAARETAMSDFLDIFNHRFLSFLYRSRQKHAPGLNGRAPDDVALTACLDALGNLGNWSTSIPYVVTMDQGPNSDIPYVVGSRVQMQPDTFYKICSSGSGICTEPDNNASTSSNSSSSPA